MWATLTYWVWVRVAGIKSGVSATAVVLIALRLLCWGAVLVRNPRLLVEVEPGPANEALEYL